MIFRTMLVCSLLLINGAAQADESRTWRFDVKLDGSSIGSHEFVVREDGERRRVTSAANFDVRFLFITALKYRHNTTEVWDGGCLTEIDSKTRVNRKRLAVSGNRSGSAFVVDSGDGAIELDDCVMTFAYWNPAFLEQPRLLDPQSGDYLDVRVEALPSEVIDVRGEAVTASVWRLTARKMELTLWYSAQDEWLGLESVAKGGRIVRYELT